jgi:hypothetical protein
MSSDHETSPTPVGGAAVELPTNYIRQGMTENIDDAVALGDILPPRSASTAATDLPRRDPPLTTRSDDEQAVPEPHRQTRPLRASGRPRKTIDPDPHGVNRRGLTPVIKPSVVHIPATLLALIAAERQRSGRSNGQILIAAIEAGHEHLIEQHEESTSIGGRLFTARTTKPQLPVDEPLSPLNIRLYEQDYEVLDRLVKELGAGSRSRLATLALAHYLDSSA